ncbi:hypothetical protein CXG81DRAFT_25387 [Caulochytrium protostelioides]|uniref:RRM domain-containing protein n=1 Tax=Caulochytrium protostelioides TaxID=1555241 RepID=A0A4P9XA79_9FUNG|nr:hypothetical protein CXG81DRAFT_25387 [Caulochytrium protostelioides]|eukprot:RKP01971.1 hypothetical protein CXG81DRAFT_25387 [Caulochytrium protostelioides]
MPVPAPADAQPAKTSPPPPSSSPPSPPPPPAAAEDVETAADPDSDAEAHADTDAGAGAGTGAAAAAAATTSAAASREALPMDVDVTVQRGSTADDADGMDTAADDGDVFGAGDGTLIPPSATLYIKNLNEKVSIADLRRTLYTLFGQFGRVIDIVAQRGERKRGQAFVVFDQVARATLALRHLQGQRILGQPLRASYARTKSHAVRLSEFAQQARQGRGGSAAASAKAAKRKTAAELSAELDAQGEADNADGADGAADGAATSAAMGAARGSKRARPTTTAAAAAAATGNPAAPRTLYVTNLPPGLAVSDMTALFEAFPGFTALRPVVRAGTARTAGVGAQVAFVDFDALPHAQLAQQGLHGLDVTGHKLVVQLAKTG